jgi:hypothetical protein
VDGVKVEAQRVVGKHQRIENVPGPGLESVVWERRALRSFGGRRLRLDGGTSSYQLGG